jgi:hypothetical protein
MKFFFAVANILLPPRSIIYFLLLILIVTISKDEAMAAPDQRFQYKNRIESLLNRTISMRLFGEFMDIPLSAEPCLSTVSVKQSYFVPCKFLDIKIRSFGRHEATFEIVNNSSDAASIMSNAEFLLNFQSESDYLRSGQKDFQLSKNEMERLYVFRQNGFDIGRNTSLLPTKLRYKAMRIQFNIITVEK